MSALYSLKTRPPVDWPRVVAALAREGRAVATLTGEPSHSQGEALLDLWCDVMDKPLADVPRRQRS
jgi:hypothetical protein